jgi:heme A synthase
MTLVQVHEALSRACVLFSLIIGLYGLWRFFRKEGVDGNFLSILAAGEVLYVAQGIIGVALFVMGERPARTAVHILYGVLIVIALPATFAYLRGREERREALIYGLVGFFLAGLALRAIITAAA